MIIEVALTAYQCVHVYVCTSNILQAFGIFIAFIHVFLYQKVLYRVLFSCDIVLMVWKNFSVLKFLLRSLKDKLKIPPHLAYVATLPCNLSLIFCFDDINVSQGSVAT